MNPTVKACVHTAFLASTLLTANAMAGQQGAFFGGGFNFANIKTENIGEYSLNAIDIAGGFMLNEFFGLEARLGTGVSSDSKNVNPGTILLNYEVKTKITNYWGLFVRPQFQAEHFQGYLLLGYGGADVNMSSPDLPEEFQLNGSDSGASWGAGAGFSPDGNLFFNVEFMNYIDSKDYEFTGINLRAEFKI
ncbi:opacity protein-like surface antigen [Alteromonadaceae bacterium 2753L.S.0a.02]|nr:opacity protein-like surface antigen [Alteromonadaceae bacterium 2753L.S.0a.02]